MKAIWFVLLLCTAILAQNGEKFMIDHAKIKDVEAQYNKLVPVEINFDHSLLNDNEMEVLKLLVKASRYMDNIFLEQVYSQNDKLQAELENLPPHKKILRDYFYVNFGPFDRLDHDKPFINLHETKPAGANFYPQDMTQAEFEGWIKEHPEVEKDFTSNFTVIRREGKKLVAIPYSVAYKEHLKPAAELLKKAAQLCQNNSLKKYLNSRAEAFLSNDYFKSDMNWMDLKNHKIEVVIGPYEVYEDALFEYKAAFESFVTLVDPVESAKLKKVAGFLTDMEKHLPIDDQYKNFNRGNSSPIMVVQEVYTAGDTKASVQTTAFNLPNDERVREAKGSKKVMLKNIARAKYDKCWVPIVKEVLLETDLLNVSFDAYFNHVLMHEMSHGLGPGIIEKNGKKTSVNNELKNYYSVIEECKADVLGVWNMQYMIDKGVFPKELEKSLYVSFLGGIFRSVRFGINEAHGGANVIALNYLLEHGGFRYDDDNIRFGVNAGRIKEAVKELAHDLLMLQATGDYEKTAAFVKKYKTMPGILKAALRKVRHVPVDIRPIYQIEKEL